MSLDFAALVLGPAMQAFGKPFTVTPSASLPDAAPYRVCGIWEEQHVDIQTMDGGVLSSNTIDLGIKLDDFTAVPQQGDMVALTSVRDWRPELLGNYIIDDVKPDGQGGAKIMLKRQR